MLRLIKEKMVQVSLPAGRQGDAEPTKKRKR
jgi:hypothetical protein